MKYHKLLIDYYQNVLNKELIILLEHSSFRRLFTLLTIGKNHGYNKQILKYTLNRPSLSPR